MQNLGVRKVKYSNVVTFEFLILIWISAIVSICASSIFKFDISVGGIFRMIREIIKNGFLSFTHLVKQLVYFSRMKNLFSLTLEVALNFTFIQLNKIERTKTFISETEEVRKYFLNWFKTMNLYTFFCYCLRAYFFKIIANYFLRRYKLIVSLSLPLTVI